MFIVLNQDFALCCSLS